MFVLHFSLMFTALLLLSGCAQAKLDMSEDLWKHWQGVNDLVQPNYPDAIPIVLIHGWNGSEFTWPEPERLQALEKRLGRDIYFFVYRTGIAANRFPPIESLEEQLEMYLSSFKQADVVAHSMGGLLLRQYLQHHATHPVRRIVFLATPHHGAHAANLLAGLAESVSPFGNPQASELQPGSDFLWQLDSVGFAELTGLPVLNLYGLNDSSGNSDMVVAPVAAWLPGTTNLAVTSDHHDIAHEFVSDEVIVHFLERGEIPAALPMPAQRNLWLRLHDPYSDTDLPLTTTSAQRLHADGKPADYEKAICCAERSAMQILPGNTLLIEQIEPGEKLRLYLRRPGQQAELLDLELEQLLDPQKPVTLRQFVLPQ